MNLDELMESIGHHSTHPYHETYIMGYEKGVSDVGFAIDRVLGKDALSKVLSHLKQVKYVITPDEQNKKALSEHLANKKANKYDY